MHHKLSNPDLEWVMNDSTTKRQSVQNEINIKLVCVNYVNTYAENRFVSIKLNILWKTFKRKIFSWILFQRIYIGQNNVF